MHRTILLALLLTGCSAQDLATLQQSRDQTATALADAQATQARLQQVLTTRPADDPVRQVVAPELTRLQTTIGQLQSVLPAIDAAMKSINANTGQLDPSVQQAVGAVPYGSLALAALALIFGAIKHVQAGNLSDQAGQAQKAFEQIVAALDAVLPNPTADQQMKVEAALDSDVKSAIAAVRTS